MYSFEAKNNDIEEVEEVSIEVVAEDSTKRIYSDHRGVVFAAYKTQDEIEHENLSQYQREGT